MFAGQALASGECTTQIRSLLLLIFNSCDFQMDTPLVFVTGNERKLQEVASILGEDCPFELIRQDLDLKEIQGSEEEICQAKCLEAVQIVKGPVVVEDTSLALSALNGLPGPYVKWFLEKIGAEVEGSCKLLHDAPNCYLGSLTPYSLAVEANDEEWKCPGCKAVFAWVMVRHGIRYPADKRIPGLKKVLHSLQDGILQNGSLSEEERKLFKEWSMEHVKEGIGHFLHEAGATEAKWLGERYKRHLPQLFHGHFNLNHFMPYKNCSSWLHEVKNNSQTYVEVEQYEKGPELAEVVDRLQQKTGVLNLTVWQVQKMYDACSYETGWDGERMSPWCTLFTPQDLKALEFAEDLELWYRDGHGHHLTYMASCGMTRDIHDHIR
ncbi:unnamed protein product [Darwinula stevensoni]|uniref:Multiple inositol polyphosphate phosphatase 1 n=1 Tax=Darwinula stevensoni TaxID=69355 RepID=A0A7R9A6X4_9CRUS|nr:unnamed protein product [Darwinula stevensoni]CAG0890651.1 unnamed protein product [Darwinula stevensoni]